MDSYFLFFQFQTHGEMWYEIHSHDSEEPISCFQISKYSTFSTIHDRLNVLGSGNKAIHFYNILMAHKIENRP